MYVIFLFYTFLTCYPKMGIVRKKKAVEPETKLHLTLIHGTVEVLNINLWEDSKKKITADLKNRIKSFSPQAIRFLKKTTILSTTTPECLLLSADRREKKGDEVHSSFFFLLKIQNSFKWRQAHHSKR